MDVNVAAWTLIDQSIHLSPLSHTALHYKQAFLILDFEWFQWRICFPEMRRILKCHFSQEIYLWLFLRAGHFSYVCLSILCVFVLGGGNMCFFGFFLNIHLKILTDKRFFFFFLFRVSEMCLDTRFLLSSHFKGAPSYRQEQKFLLRVM